MPNQKIVTEAALSAIASDIKNALSGKANSNDVYLKSQTYNKTEIDNALGLKADKSELYNLYPTDQESGAIASFTDGADNIPLKSLVSQIVAVESGSGTPSPSNPRAISGFDSGIITRCGKNLFDNSLMVNAQTTVVGDTVTLTATSNFQGSAFAFMPVKQGYKYALSFDSLTSGSAVEIRRYNASGTVTNTVVITQSTIININDGTTVKISIVYGNRTAGAGTFILKGFNIALGENYQPYQAYNGNTYTFTFGQTIFGGHFDNKGNLVVTWAAIDLGSLTWTYDSTYDRFLSNSFNIDALPSTRTMKCLCSCYQTISDGRPLAQVPNNSIYNGGGGKNLIVHDNRFTVGTDLKTAVSGQYCTYQLETPITLAITSQDIPTLLGENNIFSNCGDVEVNYRADIGLYIDKKISSLAQG